MILLFSPSATASDNETPAYYPGETPRPWRLFVPPPRVVVQKPRLPEYIRRRWVRR